MASIIDQYRIITAGAGWIDRSSRGRLAFEGADARTFLQGLLTNDVASLAAGQGVYAAYLTPNGRMLADIVVLDRGGLLTGLVGDGQGSLLAARFDQLVFTEDVRVADVTGDTGEIVVVGRAAAAVAAEAAGAQAGELESLPELGHLPGTRAFVMRDGGADLPVYRVVFDADARGDVEAALARSGAVPLRPELMAALRIEAGRAEWGADLRDDVIPLEAGLLERAISTTKGCYVGQEIVIRILHRGGGRVARRLVILVFEADVTQAPPAGGALAAEGMTGSSAGQLTSVAFSPVRERFVALGYLQRDVAEVGRRVSVAESGASAVVAGFAQ